jgi:hypothetical protein
MILNVRSKTPIKCKAAKFIRIPNASSVEVKSNEIADLFICKSNDYKTIFYIKNNTINFIRILDEDYLYKVAIVDLFDYKNWTCNLLSIDRQKYDLIRPTVSPEMFVRAPNGDLYCLIDYTYYFSDGEDENDDGYIEYDTKNRNNHRILIIHNLTKGKALFYHMESNKSPVREEDGIAVFPFFFSTNPLYNSFIIVMRVDIDDALEYSAIYLVNLLKDDVDEVTFDLRGYIKSHIDNLMDENYIENYDEDEEFDPTEHYMEDYGFDADDILNTYRITLDTMSYNCGLIKYQDKTPVFSACEAKFWLHLKHNFLSRGEEWDLDILCTIRLSVYIENNEINILLTCNKIEISGFAKSYKLEVNDILLNTKYPIHDIKNFDISKSQLYSVTSFWDDYLFQDGNIYKLDNGTYQMIHDSKKTTPFTLKRNGVFFVQLGSSSNKILAVIPPKYIHKNNERYVKINNQIVNLNVINKIANMYNKHNKYGIIVDINEHTQTIDIERMVEVLKHHIRKVLHDKKIEYNTMDYDYYFSEKTGDLYVFAMVNSTAGESIRFVIVRHKISQPIEQIATILLSDPYELKIDPKNRKEGEKGKIKIRKGYKLLNDIMKSYRLQNRIMKGAMSEKNKDIYFIDSISYIFEKVFNKAHSSCYLYNDEWIVKYYASFSNITAEFKDIMYNRQAKVKYYNPDRDNNAIYESQIKTERYENVLIDRIEIKMRGYYPFAYNFLTVISEMDVVKPVKMQVYD